MGKNRGVNIGENHRVNDEENHRMKIIAWEPSAAVHR
jgi:hypothetical protein